MSESDQVLPDIDGWATAHGFQPTDRELNGETPLLRLGLVGMTANAYAGKIAGHEALLSEFAIGSPDVSEAFGGSGVSEVWFTLFLVKLDAGRWPRLTVHPSRFSDGDWLTRLLHRDDHRVRDISPEFDRRYRVRAANSIPDEQVRELFDDQLVRWFLAQSELVFDIESNVETGGSMVVGRRGIGLSAEALDTLLGQAEFLLPRFSGDA
ncbi:MAG: hypothetical protein ACXVYV_06145 [Gaiellales bacterium]